MTWDELPFINSYQGVDSPEDFGNAVLSTAAALGIDPTSLQISMWIESRLNPQAVNNQSGATGLIQFMPATAAGLGTSTSALAQMSGVTQLSYVQQYFQGVIKQYGVPQTPEAVYLCIFFPLAVQYQSDPTWVLQTSTLSASLIASENPLYANNGQITIGDVANYVNSEMPGTITAAVAVTEVAVANNWIPIVIVAVGLIGVTFFILELHKRGKLHLHSSSKLAIA